MESPGNVYYLYFNTLYGDPKYKYCILVAINPKPIFFLINTEPSVLKKSQPEMIEGQVVIDKASHNYLHHDSYIDCTDPYGYDPDKITEEITNNPGNMKGRASDEVIGAIIKAVDNDLIPQRKIELIIESLTKVLSGE